MTKPGEQPQIEDKTAAAPTTDAPVKKSKRKLVLDASKYDTVAASNRGATLQLRDPADDEPLPFYIPCVGKHSDTFRDFLREKVNEEAAKENSPRAKAKTKYVAEAAEQEAIELLTNCVFASGKPWFTATEYGVDEHGNETDEVVSKVETIQWGNQTLDYTFANVRYFITEALAFRGQIDNWVGGIGNFMNA